MNIGYTFKNRKLLETALTHISFANDSGVESNQRLEFLGDSILSVVVSEYIYNEFKDFDEGKLTEVRAAAVCEKSLAAAAEGLGLGEAIHFGKSEERCDGAHKPSILCDTYEAVLGAIYLDGGIEPAREMVLRTLKTTIEAARAMDFRNYKSEIQNYFQKRDKNREVVTYTLVEKKGPDHAPEFEVNAEYQGKVIGSGHGRSRKAAEQEAAREALSEIEKAGKNVK